MLSSVVCSVSVNDVFVDTRVILCHTCQFTLSR